MNYIFSRLPNDLIIKIVQIENRRKYEKERMKFGDVIQQLNKLSTYEHYGPSIRALFNAGGESMNFPVVQRFRRCLYRFSPTRTVPFYVIEIMWAKFRRWIRVVRWYIIDLLRSKNRFFLCCLNSQSFNNLILLLEIDYHNKQ